jgi:hypothetical protein
MTTEPISTDPATLRNAANDIRSFWPHAAKLLRAIAAEKEAQAAPGDLVETLARAIVEGKGADFVFSDAEWRKSVAHHREMAAAHPAYLNGRGLFIDAFRDAENALSAITAAGYEIRPRAYTAGESLGGGLVAVPAPERPVIQCARCAGKGEFLDTTYDRTGEMVWCRPCHGTGKMLDDRDVKAALAALDALTKPQGDGE